MDLRRVARSVDVRLRRRLADLSPAEARRGRADRERLRARWPWFDRFEAEAPAIEDRFLADHAWYVRHVGHPVHAASLELATLLWFLCDHLDPERVIDLGSGFTSYVLRRWADARGGREVWSVDDSAEWLDKTRGYLFDRGLDDAHTLTWDELRAAEPPAFDLVLHDMGMMDVRERTLPEAVGLARPGGLVVLDDVHKPAYRAAALRWLDEKGYEHWSLKPYTRDRLTRYAELVLA